MFGFSAALVLLTTSMLWNSWVEMLPNVQDVEIMLQNVVHVAKRSGIVEGICVVKIIV